MPPQATYSGGHVALLLANPSWSRRPTGAGSLRWLTGRAAVRDGFRVWQEHVLQRPLSGRDCRSSSWPGLWVRQRARKLTFDAWAWPAEVSCRRWPGTHAAGQLQSFDEIRRPAASD